MKEVLILTGACGVGKSTVSITWAKHKKGAIIEVDFFTEWIFNDILKTFSIEEEKFLANATFVLAKEYLSHGMDVAIENVWTPAGLEILKNRFEQEIGNVLLKFVWLRCDIDENHRRDEQRVSENQMKERVDIVNDELHNYEWQDYLNIIDSTNLTAEATYQKIERIDYLS